MPDLTAIARVVAIAVACGAALAGTNWLTEEKIRYNEAAGLRAAIASLLPAVADASDHPPEVDRVPGAWTLCSGHLLGRSDAAGYGGSIRLLYSLEMMVSEPHLVRLMVLGHQETPGIADFLSDPDWRSAFSGSADDIEEIAAITGATITSNGIRDHLSAVLREPAGQLGPAEEMACPG